MSLETRIQTAVTTIAQEFKRAYERVGTLGSLNTTEKATLVAAINSLLPALSAAEANATFNMAAFQAMKDELLAGADPAFDTLKELHDAILGNQNQLTALLTNLGGTVRYDTAQALAELEKTTARANIDALGFSDVGNIELNLLANFNNMVGHIITTGDYVYAVPAGVTQVMVTIVGGGAGSWGCNSGWCTSGGGGAWVKDLIVPVTPGAIIPYTIGAGGAKALGYDPPGYAHNYNCGRAGNGGNSSFGSIVMGGGQTFAYIYYSDHHQYDGSAGGSANGVPGAHDGEVPNSYGAVHGGSAGQGGVGAGAEGDGKNGMVLISTI